MLHIFGIPVSVEDARWLVATLVAKKGSAALAAAARVTAALDRGSGAVGLEPKQRDAVLRTLEDPPDGLVQLRCALAEDAARRHGLA